MCIRDRNETLEGSQDGSTCPSKQVCRQKHTWIKGHIKGIIALFVDDMMQAGAKASNVEFLKALESIWTMSSPEHLGPLDRHEKLKFIGVMISRQPQKDQ
eukprot:12065032-Prorocentrum_lima.AAC.1